MHIKVRNIGGIERADIASDGIVLVAGRNGAGKSSLLRVTAAALTGDLLPGGMKKAAAGGLVRTGAETGTIKIETVKGTVGVSYPKAERVGDTDAPQASLYAAGLIDILTLPDKTRASVLAQYLGAVPVYDDLRARCTEQGIPEGYAEKVWGAICGTGGWDGAHDRAKERGAVLKAQWEAISHENYGSTKAPQWLPQGWRETLLGSSVEGLEEAVVQKRQALETAIGGHAVAEADLARWRDHAGAEIELEHALETASKDRAEAEAEMDAAQAALNALPTIGTQNGIACPHCAKPLRLVKVNQEETRIEALPEPKQLTEAEKKKLREDRMAADGRLERATTRFTTAKAKVTEVSTAYDAARRDRLKLEEHEKAAPAAAPKVVDKAREALALVEADLTMFKAKAQADTLARGIAVNQALVHILAQDGLRKDVVAKAVDKFNKEHLQPLSVASGWPPIEVQADMTITYRGRATLLSGGELYRVRAALQVAFAKLDGSALVILDGADILDPPGRQGLIRMLAAAQVPALIGMTYAGPKTVPDLSQAGGATYWLDGGIASPLADAQRAAAERAAAA